MRRRRFDHDDAVRLRHGPRAPALRLPTRDSTAVATHPMLSLQRTIGNRAVARAIEAGQVPAAVLQRDAASAAVANANPWSRAEATTQFVENYAELPKLMAAMHRLKSLSHIPAMESIAGLSGGPRCRTHRTHEGGAAGAAVLGRRVGNFDRVPGRQAGSLGGRSTSHLARGGAGERCRANWPGPASRR